MSFIPRREAMARPFRSSINSRSAFNSRAKAIASASPGSNGSCYSAITKEELTTG
ncbi:MAG TPA: hypothetical protein V6D27_10340 [Vampirovibrionales bacterium]